MKLYYYNDPLGNFGDDLNPWLWDKLLPDFFDESEAEWLVGIGTLLNHKLPKTGMKYVLGSGFGYGTPPAIDDTFHFFSVRGPKTAEILGLDSSLALTDPAILTRTVFRAEKMSPGVSFGFVPHQLSAHNFSWERICNYLGFKYLSVEWPVEKFLKNMTQCDVLLCEAMHGAIVADALRIPWIPVSGYDYIDSFKWQDWLSTVNLPYDPIRITSLFDREEHMGWKERLKNQTKRHIKSVGIWNDNWSAPAEKSSTRQQIEKAAMELETASRSHQFLSEDRICEELTGRQLEVLERVKLLRTNM